MLCEIETYEFVTCVYLFARKWYSKYENMKAFVAKYFHHTIFYIIRFGKFGGCRSIHQSFIRQPFILP